MKEKIIYYLYFGISLIYLIIKAATYPFLTLGPFAIILGLIATVLTLVSGIIALLEFQKDQWKTRKPIGHWLALLFPIVLIPLTPGIMILQQEFEWTHDIIKIVVLIVFEVVAITQIILAIFMYKFNKMEQSYVAE